LKEDIEKADLAGKRMAEDGRLNPERPDHEHLLAIVQTRPTDYEPDGFRVRNGSDCSHGCRWFLVLQDYPLDWGVCANARSPRCGLLTFEHQGCQHFQSLEDEEEELDI
jgi:hypothetical protein